MTVGALFVTVASTVGSTVGASASAGPSHRLAGSDRYGTAAAVAQAGFPHGAATVYLASGTVFADGLTGTPAAVKAGGPLLLTSATSLPAATADELRRLHPQHLVVLGGFRAVGDNVVAALRTITGASVDRLAAGDRYSTAAIVSKASFPGGASSVLLASGEGFADALSGGAAAGFLDAPLLLTRAGTLPPASAAELTRLHPRTVLILGGTSAISSAVAEQVSALTGRPAKRLSGTDRYLTSLAVDQGVFASNPVAGAYLASGESFPDGLTAGVLAARAPGPLLLSRSDCVSTGILSELASQLVSAPIAVGGTAVLGGAAAGIACSAPAVPPTTPLAPVALPPVVTVSGSGQSLTVTITDLPAGVPADVTVSGPGFYTKHLTSTTALLGLAPGDYRVTSAAVHYARVSYEASTAGETVSVSDSGPTDVLVDYFDQVPDTTRVISAAAVRAVTGSADGIQTITLAGATGGLVSPVLVGDYLVISDGVLTPGGLLVHVDQVSANADSATAVVSPASLLQAVTQGQFDVTADLTPTAGMQPSLRTRVKGVGAALRASAAPLPLPQRLSKNFTCSASGSASLEASANISTGMHLTAKWSSAGLATAEFTANVTGSLSAKATVEAGAKCTLDRTNISPAGYNLPVIRFAVGGIPVWITPNLNLSVTGKATAALAITAGIKKVITASAGLAYSRDRGFQPISSLTATDNVDLGTLEGSADVEATVGPIVTMKLYGVAGPAFNLDAGPKFHAVSTATPWWTLEGCLTAGAKLTIKKLDIDYGNEAILQKCKQLAAATTGPPLQVATLTLPTASTGRSYRTDLAGSGGAGGDTWAITGGVLPAGLTANGAQINGTPTAAGSYPITVQVTDSTGKTASRALTLIVDLGSLQIRTKTLPAGTVGSPYAASLSAAGGSAPTSWSLISGALPAGLKLDAKTGVISGTPTAVETAAIFGLQVTDALGQTANVTTAIAVGASATGGVISGKVTEVNSGSGLAGVQVDAFSSKGEQTGAGGVTQADGTYAVTGLTDGTYSVCFDAKAASGGISTTGHPDQCYKGVAWDGDPKDIRSTTAVKVVAGATTSSIDATLAEAGAISGTVTDTSGRPLQDALVNVDSTSSGFLASAVTRSDGSYTVTGLPAGFQTICFNKGGVSSGRSSASGYLPQCFKGVRWDGYSNEIESGATPVEVTSGATTPNIDVALVPGGAISGRVTDTSAHPLQQVRIKDSGDVLTYQAATAPDGTYTMFGLPTGSYQVCFDASGASGGASTTGYVGKCYPAPVPVTVGSTTPHINAELPLGGAITGLVTDASSQPLSNVQVSSAGATATTGVDGTYRLSGLPEGTAQVCFDAIKATGGSSVTGYVSDCYAGSAGNAAGALVKAGATTPNIDAALVSGATISGTVTDASGHPLRQVAITVVNGRNAATTGVDGTYAVTGLATGSVDVCFDARSAAGGSADATGYLNQCFHGGRAVSVTAPGTTRGIDASLAFGAAISGSVTDASSHPLENVAVHVITAGGTPAGRTTTTTEGAYVIVGLPEGSYHVCFDPTGSSSGTSTTGYTKLCYKNVPWDGKDEDATGAANFATTAGAFTSKIDATLTPAGGISGTATDASSRPLSGVRISVFNAADTEVGSSSSSLDGTYNVPGLTDGTYHVCFGAQAAIGGSSVTGYADQCYHDVAWNAGNYGSSSPPRPPPAAAVGVQVTVGSATAGIDAHLAAFAVISGTVTDSGLHPLVNVTVSVSSSTGDVWPSVHTGSVGTYTLPRLPMGTYRVCFDATGAVSGSSGAGYLDQCTLDLSAPAGSTLTVDEALVTASGLLGTVTDSAARPLQDVSVRVTTPDGTSVGTASTAADGTYAVRRLPAGTYQICFNASVASGGSSTVGYLDQCYKNVAWDGYSATPAGAVGVSLTAGLSTAKVDAVLVAFGRITGTVTDKSAQPLQNLYVRVFALDGTPVQGAYTGVDGTFAIRRLPVATYNVCFDSNHSADGTSATDYADQCYKNVAWDGTSAVPAGATPVTLTAGSTTPSIDAALVAYGRISGTVTDSAARSLQNVGVRVFTAAGGDAGYTSTTADGTYMVRKLAAGTYKVCFTGTYVTGGNSSTGYLAQCYKSVAWDGTSAVPAGATPVILTAGSTTPSIDAALAPSGSVSGTVTDSAARSLQSVGVRVFTAAGGDAGYASTAADGSYMVRGLAAGTYKVCFTGTYVTGGNSSTGYLAQCYKNVAWDGTSSVPAGATPVTLTAGSTTPSIDAALGSSASFSGTVTDSAAGPLQSVGVRVFTAAGGDAGYASTAADGSYMVRGLAAGIYKVCFTGSYVTGGSSSTGYLAQCYKNIAWDGFSAVPAGATPVTLTAGSTTPSIDAALGVGAAVIGTVTDTSGRPLQNAGVDVSSAGLYVGSASTAADGSYMVRGLAAGIYKVCFTGSYVTGGSSSTGYLAQCYKNIAWDGFSEFPAGATPVTLTAGLTTPAIDAALSVGAAVTGTVTDTSGRPLQNAVVDVSSAGGDVGSASTAADGTYAVLGVAAGTYDVCFTGSYVTGGSSRTGYLSQCYKNVAWDGSSAVPAGATPVTLSAGLATPAIDAALSVGAAVTGTVTDTSGRPLQFVSVQMSSAGRYVGSASTAADGTYAVRGVAAGTYDVCFTGSYTSGGGSAGGYLAQCYKNVASDGFSAVPAGATPVTLTAGLATPAIDAALSVGAAVTGTVTDTSGRPLRYVSVQVSSAGRYVGSASTAADGTYAVRGVAAGTYDVCFTGSYTSGGGSAGGYLAQCYKNVAWDGFSAVPAGATPVTLTAGLAIPAIDAALGVGAAVSGTLTDTSARPLQNVSVEVFTTGGKLVGDGGSAADGTYTVRGVAAGTYDVCFKGSSYTNGTSTTGYLASCYGNVAWDGVSAPPSGAAGVVLAAGLTTPGINAALAVGGAISGTVSDASARPLQNVFVQLFSAGGSKIGYAFSAADGSYTIGGVAAGTYSVCFNGSNQTSGASATGYVDQCYKNVVWDGTSNIPVGATGVTVAIGSMTRGVNAGLTAK